MKNIRVTRETPKPGATFLCCHPEHAKADILHWFRVSPPPGVLSSDRIPGFGIPAHQAKYMCACDDCLSAAGGDILRTPMRAAGVVQQSMFPVKPVAPVTVKEPAAIQPQEGDSILACDESHLNRQMEWFYADPPMAVASKRPGEAVPDARWLVCCLECAKEAGGNAMNVAYNFAGAYKPKPGDGPMIFANRKAAGA